MTLAEAILHMHNGEEDGLSFVISYTAPSVWLAVSLLCGENIGSTMTEIYGVAKQRSARLRSPSDLRIWMSQAAYPVLLEKMDKPAEIGGNSDSERYYRMLTALPREERVAVLLLCGEGCTAAQASLVLEQPEIEIKRALRRARGALAEQAKADSGFAGTAVNTAWMIQRTTALRQELAQNTELFAQVTHCVLTGEAFVEPKKQEAAARTGFFQKLFRRGEKTKS
ncbi:MAG: sigma factor-like helix-turn-helix DNA-binding protein [Butyricicoccus sp.]